MVAPNSETGAGTSLDALIDGGSILIVDHAADPGRNADVAALPCEVLARRKALFLLRCSGSLALRFAERVLRASLL